MNVGDLRKKLLQCSNSDKLTMSAYTDDSMELFAVDKDGKETSLLALNIYGEEIE